MTKLIEKAESNASAYEKRSEYCDLEMAKVDLDVATQLDPLRTYPYRFRAAGISLIFHSLPSAISFLIGDRYLVYNMFVVSLDILI